MKGMDGEIQFCIAILLLSALCLSTSCVANSNKFISGELTQEGATRLVYGNWKSDAVAGRGPIGIPRAEWRPTDSCSFSVLERLSHPEEIYEAEVVFFKPYETKTGREYLLVTGTGLYSEMPACLQCGGMMGIFVFNQVAHKWRLKKSNKCFAFLGTFGRLPGDMRVVEIGQNNFGVLMFYEISSAQVGLLIAEYKNDFAILFSKETADSSYARPWCDENHEQCYSYQSSITFVPGNNPEFYDLVLKQEGTKGIHESEEVIRWSKTIRLVFENGKYEEK